VQTTAPAISIDLALCFKSEPPDEGVFVLLRGATLTATLN
jgi:hypothetical protein